MLGKGSFSRSKDALKPGGRYLCASFKLKQLLQMLWTSIKGGKRVICALSNETHDNLLFITSLVEAGTLKSVVDRSFPMEQAAEAHPYVEGGHKKGHVVITMAHSR